MERQSPHGEVDTSTATRPLLSAIAVLALGGLSFSVTVDRGWPILGLGLGEAGDAGPRTGHGEVSMRAGGPSVSIAVGCLHIAAGWQTAFLYRNGVWHWLYQQKVDRKGEGEGDEGVRVGTCRPSSAKADPRATRANGGSS